MNHNKWRLAIHIYLDAIAQGPPFLIQSLLVGALNILASLQQNTINFISHFPFYNVIQSTVHVVTQFFRVRYNVGLQIAGPIVEELTLINSVQATCWDAYLLSWVRVDAVLP